VRQTVVLVALFLATLVLALWALGVFEPSRPPPPAPEVVEGPTGGMTSGGDLAPVEPREEPPLDRVPLPAPVRVLALGQAPRSFSLWLFQLWGSDRRVAFQAWFAEGGGQREPAHSSGLPALAAPPKKDLLPDVQVLVLDDVDPAAFPDDFWTEVSDRVRSGSLGLLVLPGVRHGVLLASRLEAVMPLKAKPVAALEPGSKLVAGVFDEPRRFYVTDAGKSHPASRLVQWPSWSAKKWEALGAAPKPWATKFVHPVSEVLPGSATLLTVKGHRAEDVPALVASDPARGRVVWAGFFDVGDAAYRDGNRSADVVRALTVAWLAWLAGVTG
jgi:hypothetical protein